MADQYVADGVLFLRSLNIRPFGLDLSDVKYVSPEFHATIKKSELEEGDVVIVRTGRPGTCAVIPKGLGLVNCSDLVIVRCGPKLRPHFLCYWVNAMAGHHVRAHAVGAVQQHFNVGSAKQIELPIPSLKDQDLVLGVLRSLDDRIDNLRETNATLEAIAQALFKSWFVDFDPVRAKVEGREPEGMDAATAALFPDQFEDSELGPIPNGWAMGTVGDSAVLNAAKWTVRKHPNSVKYVDLSGVSRNRIETCIEFDFDAAPSRARNHLREGDTIVGTVRPGNRAYAYIHEPEENLTGSTGFAVLSPNKPCLSSFVYLASTSDGAIDRLANLADGAAYPAVRPSVVADTPCILPSSSVLETFAQIATPVLEKIAKNNARAGALVALRDTLLPRLISGKLRLPEAEQEGESATA